MKKKKKKKLILVPSKEPPFLKICSLSRARHRYCRWYSPEADFCVVSQFFFFFEMGWIVWYRNRVTNNLRDAVTCK